MDATTPITLHPRLHPALRFFTLLAEIDADRANALADEYRGELEHLHTHEDEPYDHFPDVAQAAREAYYDAKVKARRLPRYAALPHHPGDLVLVDGEPAYVVDYGPEASDGHLGTDHYLVNKNEAEYDEPGTCRWADVGSIERIGDAPIEYAVHIDGVVVKRDDWPTVDRDEAVYDDEGEALALATTLKKAWPDELVTIVLWTKEVLREEA